ncbi:MAG: peptidoglycan recognition protein family protein [Synechococcus sp. Tobar2m-G35]|jgi:N-acetylmuramoyl-L-alanine amidase|nr:peptidoglycan recognition protein family protein [Synechococcus sp. Tobar2m-G35]
MSAPSPVAPRQGALNQHPRSQRSLLLALGVGTAVTVGLAAVVVSGLRKDPVPDGLLLRRPGIGWIREAARTPSEQRDRTPAPPSQARWVSPLTRACPAADPVLRQHLSQMPLQISKVRPDPTNYSSRRTRDAFGQAIDPTPSVIVLHETVYGLQSAVNSVTTPHANDDDQASYHTLVGLDGQIVRTVDPSQRAYGAGFSAFDGRWVFTNRRFSGSLNNFALHVSLETPEDGEDSGPNHSGYTPAQYDALARVIADWMVRYGIRPEAITTHRHVDLGGERADPRSFDWTELQRRLTALGLVCVR